MKNCVDQVIINPLRFDEIEEEFLEAKHQAYFLFGDDVHNYLETLRKDILTVRDIDKQVAILQKQNKPITGLAQLGAKRDEAMSHIQKFYEVSQQKFASPPRSWARKLVEILGPYLRNFCKMLGGVLAGWHRPSLGPRGTPMTTLPSEGK